MVHEVTTSPLHGVELTQEGVHYGIFDHGAHVWAWNPEGGEPVLWMSERSMFEAGQPVRGGIPVCFPWFGPGRDGNLQPGHGFARTTEWKLVDATTGDDGRLVVEYHLDETISGEQPDWPHRYTARLKATFGPEFEVTLTVTNTDEQAFTFEEAVHTYLRVGDVRHVRISGLAGAEYLDKVAGEWATQVGDIEIISETDRVYVSTEDVLLDDPTGRKLVIGKSGSANTVVWNPWVAKSASMPDFGDDEWTGMICIEAGNVLDDAITLQPGDSHTMTQHISIL